MISCRNCQEPFSISAFSHCCPSCGGLYGFKTGLHYQPDRLRLELPGIWIYRDSFSLPTGAPLVSLGEGRTPLVWTEIAGRQVGLKLESLNPTGSFKDRGTTVLVSWLLAAKINRAVEDSSGNAGASFAAYASRAGISGKVFVPSYASGPKLAQIDRYGLEVVSVPGPRSGAARAVLEEVNQGGTVYASHAYLPHGLAGIATIAYELIEQLGKTPGTVLVPVGHGSLLLGINLGFDALLKSGVIARYPRMVGIQSALCAPIFQAYQSGVDEPVRVQEKQTIAEGVAIANPFHGQEVLAAVRRSQGEILAVEENHLRQGQRELAGLGFDVEMTSALVGSAVGMLESDTPQPVIGIVSGHGLKNE